MTDPVAVKQRDNALIERWKQGDERAGEKLLSHYDGFIRKRVNEKAAVNQRLDREDLYSEARMGFLQAMQKFDPAQDVQISTYAEYWMKACMNDHEIRTHGALRLPTTADARKIFFKMAHIRRLVEASKTAEPLECKLDKIAQTMEVSSTTLKTMFNLMAQSPLALDAPLNAHEEDSGSFQDTMADPSASAEDVLTREDETTLRRQWLRNSLEQLDQRDRDILESRRLMDEDEQMTLEQLGVRYGISKERIRQLEERAYARLQKSMLTYARQYRSALD